MIFLKIYYPKKYCFSVAKVHFYVQFKKKFLSQYPYFSFTSNINSLIQILFAKTLYYVNKSFNLILRQHYGIFVGIFENVPLVIFITGSPE